MSLSRDRLTFIGVMIGVGVAVFGYMKLGSVYPTAGRGETAPAQRSSGEGVAGGQRAEEDAGHLDDDGPTGPEASLRDE